MSLKTSHEAVQGLVEDAMGFPVVLDDYTYMGPLAEYSAHAAMLAGDARQVLDYLADFRTQRTPPVTKALVGLVATLATEQSEHPEQVNVVLICDEGSQFDGVRALVDVLKRNDGLVAEAEQVAKLLREAADKKPEDVPVQEPHTDCALCPDEQGKAPTSLGGVFGSFAGSLIGAGVEALAGSLDKYAADAKRRKLLAVADALVPATRLFTDTVKSDIDVALGELGAELLRTSEVAQATRDAVSNTVSGVTDAVVGIGETVVDLVTGATRGLFSWLDENVGFTKPADATKPEDESKPADTTGSDVVVIDGVELNKNAVCTMGNGEPAPKSEAEAASTDGDASKTDADAVELDPRCTCTFGLPPKPSKTDAAPNGTVVIGGEEFSPGAVDGTFGQPESKPASGDRPEAK